MKNTDFVKYLDDLEKRYTLYNNSFPYNLCYCSLNSDSPDGYAISSDCWNTIKAILWSNGNCVYSKTAGTYAAPNISVMGDYDICGIFDSYATKRSTDFSDLLANGVGGEIIRMNNEHAGVYVGGGYVIESTPIWENGVQRTHINAQGQRISLEQYGGQYGGNWTEWARISQIDYGTQPEPQPAPTGKSVTYASFDNTYGTMPAVVNDSDYAGYKGNLGAFTCSFTDGGHTYSAHFANGGWGGDISGYNPDFSDTNNYSGERGAIIDFVTISGAGYKYRAQINNNEWLPWVYSKDSDKNNYDTGSAGDGRAITGIQICPE